MKKSLVLVIVCLAVAAVGVSVLAWKITGPSKMTIHGYIALGIALVLGGGLAAGLMWLAFYSDRKGWDQPPDEM
jgi:protein-S-isoprenylcysteine O-methyltransferase Ste14